MKILFNGLHYGIYRVVYLRAHCPYTWTQKKTLMALTILRKWRLQKWRNRNSCALSIWRRFHTGNNPNQSGSTNFGTAHQSSALLLFFAKTVKVDTHKTKTNVDRKVLQQITRLLCIVARGTSDMASELQTEEWRNNFDPLGKYKGMLLFKSKIRLSVHKGRLEPMKPRLNMFQEDFEFQTRLPALATTVWICTWKLGTPLLFS